MKSFVTVMNNIIFLKKFKGCLLGSLLGDCLGAPFEFEGFSGGWNLVLQNYFNKLEGPYFEDPQKSYTDDTAMTKALAQSLIDKNGLDPKDLAINFVKEYFKDTRRGYGNSVPEVFHKLRSQQFSDVFQPAKLQFGGAGSFGNGGAMRISPIALFYHNDYEKMLEAARLSTEITHTHVLAVNGALLQCIAVYQSLTLDPKEPLDVNKFISDLSDKMSKIEKSDGIDTDKDRPYQKQLEKMKQLLQDKSGSQYDKVVEHLGNEIDALHSVPSAIFSFLRAQTEVGHITTDNPFRRTLQYAISLGGDTDTIASMAGSIAGAYYGTDLINENLIKHCEDSEVMISLAEQLFDLIKLPVEIVNTK